MKVKCTKCGRMIDPRGMRGHLLACEGQALPNTERKNLLEDLLKQLEARQADLSKELHDKRNALMILEAEDHSLSVAIDALRTALKPKTMGH